MSELPNENWIRSPKIQEYAICLDKTTASFGWKMKEHPDGGWITVSEMTLEDIAFCIRNPSFDNHKTQLSELMELKITKLLSIN